MGEDNIIDFVSLKQTLVFWNIDDYPIPVDATDALDPVFADILKALDLMGFRYGYMDVNLYSEKLNCDKKEDEIINGLVQGVSYSAFAYKVPAITLYMIRLASMIGPGPVNICVIAKPKRELHRVLQCLKSRRHNVVLVVPPPPPDEEFLFSVDFLLENSRLLGGGKPRFKDFYRHCMYEYDMSAEKYVEIKEDVSKTVDFSERIPTVKGARTAVFWDAVACPFPLGSTPDEIYNSISSALVAREFSDNITIWAYLDDDDKRLLGGDKTWLSRIHFLPGGDKASRRVRMLNDIYLWKRDSPPLVRHYEASLLIFSDQFNDDAYYTDMLQNLANMHYDLLLVTPTLDINKPECPEWPLLLLDRGAHLFDDETSRISQQPSSLKQTYVFWNIDDYPIPVDGSVDLSPVFGDMSKALDVMGFCFGYMDVTLYSEQVSCDKKESELFNHCLIQFVSLLFIIIGESYRARVYKVPDITLRMIRFASMLGPGPINFLVIAKPKRELHRVLHCLKSRRHNVVLVEPPPDEESYLFTLDSLLNNARLLDGGKPRYKARHSHRTYQYDLHVEKDQVVTKEDVSKTVDFSERIPTVKGVRTAVFWDTVDCPFPLGSTPDEIYNSISSALVAREFSDNITIWAYLDDDDKRLLGGDKTWLSRIHFLPGGDKRRVRMLNDIYLWVRDSPQMKRSYEASLFIFSDQFEDAAYYTNMLQKLGDMRYELFVATPKGYASRIGSSSQSLDINNPESPDWPGLLMDKGAYFFNDETSQISQESSSLTLLEADDATAEEEEVEEERPEMLSDMEDYRDEEEMLVDDTLPLEPRTDHDAMNLPGWPGWEKHNNSDDMYRWDPITMMYKLKSLFPKEHEADATAEEETPEKHA
ncbi:unnamed protein product [Eruca vesicaria subsp. sativa]|uniref:NYN domain-containing protein n=1 Tax=Eruca vesicaria subsp. sativa TaxID=29727 RepID=A0ABC8JA52_ERUVS|nr:unnamed protein product [Eruca vesicaria subsp. sativa]